MKTLTILYIVLSFIDLCLTLMISLSLATNEIAADGKRSYVPAPIESNCIADTAFVQGGIVGFIVYKFLLTALVASIANFVFNYRKSYGYSTLAFGCMAQSWVVGVGFVEVVLIH